jgi:hypothetical protein
LKLIPCVTLRHWMSRHPGDPFIVQSLVVFMKKVWKPQPRIQMAVIFEKKGDASISASLIPKSTLWSSNSLFNPQIHSLILNLTRFLSNRLCDPQIDSLLLKLIFSPSRNWRLNWSDFPLTK